jgi:hypothetical protein
VPSPIIDDIWVDAEGNIGVVWRIDSLSLPRFVGAPTLDVVRKVMMTACRHALDVEIEIETVVFGGVPIGLSAFIATQRTMLALHLARPSAQH